MRTQRERMRVDRTTLDANDAFAPIEPIWWTANIYGSPDDYERSLASFTRSQRLMFAIHWYRAEVNNGGHDQFYDNSTGIVWRDALAGFEALQLPKFAAVLRESARRLGGDPPLIREARQDLLTRLEPQLDDLDGRFYELERTADLDAKMLDFMRNHSSDFLFDGVVEKPVLPGK
jgi:hypothetical protein